MKKRLLVLFFLIWAVCVPVLQAQGKTEVQILGKSKGTVSSLKAAGHTLVDAQATAKKLGGTVELFSASKQLKIAFPGMYAIVSAPLKQVIINTQTVALPAETVASGGKIYVPVQFFLLPQVQQALDRQITFEQNKLVVERNYTVAFDTYQQSPRQGQLTFLTKGNLEVASKQTNKHTVKITLTGAVLKRAVNQRPKDDFMRAFSVSQSGKDVIINVTLGSQAQAWQVDEQKGRLLLRCAAKALPPSRLEEAVPAEASLATEPLPAPSVQTDEEEDEAEELDLNPQDETVSAGVTATTPVLRPASPPVMSATPLPVMTADHKMRIIIDPGHGGKDPGATRRGSAREKELNLAVSKHLYNYLKKQGYEVKLTRSDDTFVTLAGRSKMANEFKADLFVSIHTNATKRSTANGFEVYFRSDKATDTEAAEIAAFENESLQYEETHYNFVDKLLQSLAKNEYMNESSKLAGYVRNYVYKEPGIGIAVRQNNSIKQANFYVLRGVQAPAILVEMGFISSPKDRARLNNKSAQKKMGEGIAKGVVAYLKAERKVK